MNRPTHFTLALLAGIAILACPLVVCAEDPPAVRPDATIMTGSPPFPEKRVTLENWQWQPFIHSAFLHVEQVVRVSLVDRGGGANNLVTAPEGWVNW